METTGSRTYSIENEISELELSKMGIAEFEEKIINDFSNFVKVNELAESIYFSHLLKFGISNNNYLYLEGEISITKEFGHEKNTFCVKFIETLKKFIRENKIKTISEFSYFYKFTKRESIIEIQNNPYYS